MTVTLEQAQAKLPQLLAGMAPGEELMIVNGNVRIAKLIAEDRAVSNRRIAGRGKGEILFMADDFNTTPEDFQEYAQ